MAEVEQRLETMLRSFGSQRSAAQLGTAAACQARPASVPSTEQHLAAARQVPPSVSSWSACSSSSSLLTRH